jgi:hypothetical protein
MMVKLKMANKIIVRVGIAIILVIIVAVVAKKYGNRNAATMPASAPHISSAPSVSHAAPVVPAPADAKPAPVLAPAKPK